MIERNRSIDINTRIRIALHDRREAMRDRMGQAEMRMIALQSAAKAFEDSLGAEASPEDEDRLDRLVKVANRAEELAGKLFDRVTLLDRALCALQEEEEVFGRVRPVSLAEMLREEEEGR